MKKLAVIVFWALLFSVNANAQYIVTKVSGKVKNGAGKYVKPGVELKSDDHLTWSSLNDKLWVVIIGKGEKIISPSADASPGNNVFTQLLSSSLHQDSRSGSLSGRGQIIEKIPDALHVDAKSNGKVIIAQDGKYLFDPQQFPQTGGSLFFVEIDVPGEVPILRQLKTNNDTLYFDYNDLATETVNPAMHYKLGYKGADKNSQLVATFDPFFDLNSEMESTIANTILAYSKTDAAQEAVRDSVYNNIYANIGKPNGLLFISLFNKYWQSKGRAENGETGQVFTGDVYDPNVFSTVPVLTASAGSSRAELPRNFSLQQYAPPVGDQGQTGSCVGWSTSYAARTISYAVQHGYSKNNHYELILSNTFSPDFIYNNIKTKEDCLEGTVMANALAYMKIHGDIKRTSDFVCSKKYNQDELVNARNYTIKDFNLLSKRDVNKEQLIKSMKMALVNKHPLPFAMVVTPAFSNVSFTGIWEPEDDEYQYADDAKSGREPNPARHAMCVIGYDDDRHNGSFEVMNSWGTSIGRGAKGFYWINYDDFYKFLSDIYTIMDREPEDAVTDVAPLAPTSVTTVVKPAVVMPSPVIKPLVVVPVRPVIRNEKPRIKGSLEYILLNPDNSTETVPVEKHSVNGSGEAKSAFANYSLAKPLYTGNHYRIKFYSSQSVYVYLIGMDKQSKYTLFPRQKINESALLNFNDAELYLPSETDHYFLDAVTGIEKTCVLVSKSPIDINALNEKLVNGQQNFYHDVKEFLGRRLIEEKPGIFMNNKIDFDTPLGENDVLSFFIEINHL